LTEHERSSFLLGAFHAGLDQMGLEAAQNDEDLTFSPYGLSVGGQVLDHGDLRWLRVKYVSRRDRYGLAGSADIPRVGKPTWYRTDEFKYGRDEMRGDLMSVAPSAACARGMILARAVEVSDGWLRALRCSVEALAQWPTDRVMIPQHRVTSHVLARVGSSFPCRVERFVCGHSDLSWANVTAPTFCLLDWDDWGLAPAGYGPALLYASALLQPDVAQAVYATFADDLDSSDGRVSLILAADRLLIGVGDGEFSDTPGIADALHSLVRWLVRE
jgi:hypothetical protein